MPEPAQAAPPKNAGTFASFLASFTGIANNPDDELDLTDLADDVATISYERALRAHRRVAASECATEQLQENPLTAPTIATPAPAPGSKKRKSASITLRLTAAEQAQLHLRAAAAQISVSATSAPASAKPNLFAPR